MDREESKHSGSGSFGAESHELLGKHWGRMVVTSVILVILGVLAVSLSVFVTLASMVIIGWLLVIGGIVLGVNALSGRKTGVFFADLLFAILYVVVGALMIGHPVAAATGLTFLLISFLLVIGVFRTAVAAVAPSGNRWSVLASGLIDIFLGVILWSGWPETALWVLGFFIGIEMILYGWSGILLGLMLRHVPVSEVEQKA